MGNLTMRHFHEMEVKYNLFNIGSHNDEPIWDYLRYYIYCFLTNKSVLHNKHSKITIVGLRDFLFSIFSCFRLLFKRHRIMFVEYPRKSNKEGLYYDHISCQFIDSLSKEERVVISILPYRKTLFHDINIKAINILRYFISKSNTIRSDDYNVIKAAIENEFGCNVPYSFVDGIYKQQKFSEKKFDIILDILKPHKIFVSSDLQKPLYLSAKKRKIKTYEIQHAGLVYEYPNYSYPNQINSNDNVSFANYYLLFGKEWMKVNNIPTNRIVIGNDCFFDNHEEREIKQKYLVIVSSRIHSQYLIPLAMHLSELLPDYIIVYKLHPDENIVDGCFNSLKKNSNIIITSNRYNLQTLITYSDMVVLIYSSVCFEALHNNKKVLIWKEGNYDLLSELLIDNPLVCCTNDLHNAIVFLLSEVNVTRSNEYFTHFDKTTFKTIINN